MKTAKFRKNGVTFIVEKGYTIIKSKHGTRTVSNQQLISEIEQCTEPEYSVLLKILLSHTIDD